MSFSPNVRVEYFPVAFVVPILLLGLQGCLEDDADRNEEEDLYSDGTVSFFNDGERILTLECQFMETEEERSMGLSGREGLPGGKGMLFVFGAPQRIFFWMKDMHFPIDIVFVNVDLNVTVVRSAGVEEGTPDENLTRYTGDGGTMYVVEMAYGLASNSGVGPGTRVVIEEWGP